MVDQTQHHEAGDHRLIRRIRAGDGDLLRQVRLRALQDSPSAFGSTYESESSRSGTEWEDIARRNAGGSREARFVAERDGRIVGLIGAYRADDDLARVNLVSMWVTPEVRREGIARRLVSAVVEWAQIEGVEAIELWVTEGNDAAIRLYEAAGFVLTGDRQHLPSDPSLDEVRMIRNARQRASLPDGLMARILRKAGTADLISILTERLSASDFVSLMLEVSRLRARSVTLAQLLQQYERDRFVIPALSDPRVVTEIEELAWRLLPEGYVPIELSPLSPLGTSSVMATVNQNKVVTTTRNTDVVSDSTNVLALECAARRRRFFRDPARRREPVLLAASQRVIRAQSFSGPRQQAHFRLLSLCAAGHDQGSFGFESDQLRTQISYYVNLLNELARIRTINGIRVTVTDMTDSARLTAILHERVIVPCQQAGAATSCEPDPARTSGRGYYSDACFKIFAIDGDGEEIELADGGTTRWTADLLSNAKERLVISGIAIERLAEIAKR